MSLKNELSKLIENKVISSEMAEKIEQYYNKPKEKKEVSFALFAVLGSILVGLGIILILAHNWDDLPKIVKIILSFLPLFITRFTLFAMYCFTVLKSHVDFDTLFCYKANKTGKYFTQRNDRHSSSKTCK